MCDSNTRNLPPKGSGIAANRIRDGGQLLLSQNVPIWRDKQHNRLSRNNYNTLDKVKQV